MKNFYFLFVFAFCGLFAQSQCISVTEASLNPVASLNSGIVQQITPCHRLGEYIVITGLVVGENYQFTSGVSSDYLTLTDASNNVIAFGVTPLSVSAINVSSVNLHLHADANCATDTDTFCQAATTIQCTTCTQPPIPSNDNCSSVTPTILVNGAVATTFIGTTIGATATETETSVLNGGATYSYVWEAVELTGTCNDLTVDYCGTPPGNMNNVMNVYSDCLTAFVEGNYNFSTCSDGNITVNFNAIPAGIYYLPVLSNYVDNTLGAYVMNVRSIDCPPAPDCAMAPIFPLDHAIDIDAVNPVSFTWTAPISGPAPTSYNFYAGQDPDNLNLFLNTTDTQFDIPIGAYNQLNYWKIVPMNGSTPATDCPIWSFTTESFDFQGYCLSSFGQYPTDAFTPTNCDGTTINEITALGFAGDHSLVNVTAGQTYRFTSSAPDLITISYDGISANAYGVSNVTWTAPTTGSVRFYTHLNDANCSSESESRTRSVLCGASLDIDSFNQGLLKAYPNPVEDILNLSAVAIIQKVSVFNILGQEVFSISPNAMNIEILMANLNAGAYFVKVIINDSTKTIKVIKK